MAIDLPGDRQREVHNLVMNQQTHLFGIRMTDQPLSLPGLLVFYGMLVGASDPARKLSEVFNRLQRGAAAADRVYQLYDRSRARRFAIRSSPHRAAAPP